MPLLVASHEAVNGNAAPAWVYAVIALALIGAGVFLFLFLSRPRR
jgi:hypothetical protein